MAPSLDPPGNACVEIGSRPTVKVNAILTSMPEIPPKQLSTVVEELHASIEDSVTATDTTDTTESGSDLQICRSCSPDRIRSLSKSSSPPAVNRGDSSPAKSRRSSTTPSKFRTIARAVLSLGITHNRDSSASSSPTIALDAAAPLKSLSLTPDPQDSANPVLGQLRMDSASGPQSKTPPTTDAIPAPVTSNLPLLSPPIFDVEDHEQKIDLLLTSTFPQMWTLKDGKMVPAGYNSYSELVALDDMEPKPLIASQHTVTEILRKIKTQYYYDFRSRMTQIILSQTDSNLLHNNDGTADFRVDHSLLSWSFTPARSVDATPEARPNVAVFQGPPRVLEIGCCDGEWVFKLKMQQPNWIIEGVDDHEHWLKSHPHLDLSDFMTQRHDFPNDSYFGSVPSTQGHLPSFTVRNINAIFDHKKPFPNNLYDLIRGREVFDRVENYKSFLDNLRLIMKPDGVVEFIELDPRPRTGGVEPPVTTPIDHVSRGMDSYTDNIRDRFATAEDMDLEQAVLLVPGWSERTAARLKARFRPNEDVAAPNVKSWVQGSGFWDVKQTIRRLTVGGDTRAGQLLQDFVIYRADLEDSIPKLKDALPKIEFDEVASGRYYLNIHIVTGRKPKPLRAGHLLLDNTRQEMTESKYEKMARATGKDHSKKNQWELRNDNGKLAKAMGLSLIQNKNLARDLGFLDGMSEIGDEEWSNPEHT